MARKDDYYNRAKQEGYRSRAAYKLKQLNDEYSVVNRNNSVVDLGAAPGGWLQVAAEAVGPGGTVVGVDRFGGAVGEWIDPPEAITVT